MYLLLLLNPHDVCVCRVFMGVSSLAQSHPRDTEPSSGCEPTLDTLSKEALRENDLSMADVLAVSRASLKAGSGAGMSAYTNRITLSHIEVRDDNSEVLGLSFR
jgi:hypothetical protein